MTNRKVKPERDLEKAYSTIRIPKPSFFSLENLVLSHGWVNLYPYGWLNNKLRGTFDLKNRAFDYDVTETDKSLLVNITGNLEGISSNQIIKMFEHSFSFDFPSENFISVCNDLGRDDLAKMAIDGWGRLLKGLTPWEDAVKTLFTTNCTWSNTQKMSLNLCKHLGKKTQIGRFTFPSPKVVYDNQVKVKKLKLGYRSDYLILLSERVCSGEIDLQNLIKQKGVTFNEISKKIHSFKGFGDYAANHLLVMYGWYNVLPVDREVMKNLGIKPTSSGRCPKGIEHFKEFSEFKFIAYKLDRIKKKQNWIGD
jgi:hypothetical protein